MTAETDDRQYEATGKKKAGADGGHASNGRSYPVGYARPPTASQFKPGQSGNSRGRPKGSRSIGAILEDVLSRKVSVSENGKTRRVSGLEAAMHRLRSGALRGDLPALRLLLQLHERYSESVEGAVHLDDLLPEDREILSRFASGGAESRAEARKPEGEGVENVYRVRPAR